MFQAVALSGGVDSTALALLNPQAAWIFTDTNWEHTPIYEHLKRIEEKTSHEIVRIKNQDYPGGLPEYIRKSKFFPNHGARYCTRMFKIEPMNDYLSGKLPCELLIGLRADEPEDVRAGNLSDIEGLQIRYPLRELGLTRIDVINICLESDLLPRYKPHMARGGCVGCFYKGKAQVQAMVHLEPDTADELEKLEAEVQDERGKKFHMFGNAGMSVSDIRKQPTLFSPDEIYKEIQSTPMGATCGLFCNR